MTVDKQQQELEKLDANELGNKELDTKEIAFLKSQDKLVMDFAEISEKNLLLDIQETNKRSLDKSDKVRELLTWFLLNTTGFVNELIRLKKIPNTEASRKAYTSIFDAVNKEKDLFVKEIFMMKVLFVLNTSKELSASDWVSMDAWQRITWKQSFSVKSLFDVDFVKELHSFQQHTASAGKEKWWTEADCIIGPRTIQQLCTSIGIKPVTWWDNLQIDNKFIQSSLSSKDEYIYADQAWKQMDVIVKDNGLSNVEKANAMIQVREKTVADKKYAVTSYLMTHIQDLLASCTVAEQTEIKALMKQHEEDIKLYWNADEEQSKVKKGNDIFQDMDVKVEQKEKNNKKIENILSLCTTWLTYYAKESPVARKKWVQELSSQWLQQLQDLKNSNTSATSLDQKISQALDKIFFTTEAYDIFSVLADQKERKEKLYGKYKLVNKKIPGTEDYLDNHNNQIDVIVKMKQLLLSDITNFNNPTEVLELRSNFLNNVRYVDQKLDGTTPFDTYNSWEALLTEIENQEKWQKLSALFIEDDWSKEYKDFNGPMKTVNWIFAKLDTIPPDPTTLQNIEKIMNNLQLMMRPDGASEEGEEVTAWTYEISAQAKMEFKKLFLFDLPDVQWIQLNETMKNIKKSEEKIKADAIANFKNNLQLSNKELEWNIWRYQNEIKHFQKNHPWDPKIAEYGDAITQLKSAIVNNQNGIDGKSYRSAINPNDPTQVENTTIEKQADLLAGNMWKYMFVKAFEKSITSAVIENNAAAINKLKTKKNLTPAETIINLYSNIKWIGSYWSDETFNTVLEVSKEIIIQVAICAISAWVANIAIKWAMVGTQRALRWWRTAEWVISMLAAWWDVTRWINIAAKLWRYSEIASRWIIGVWKSWKVITAAERTGALVTWAVSMTVEWTVFHISSTMLNNVYQWVDITSWLALDNKQNIRGYLQSIAFLWVIKEVWWLFNGITQKVLNNTITQAELKWVLETPIKLGLWKSILINTANFGSELIAMWVTDQIISVMFDQKPKQMSVKDMTHMVGMILGLRLTHKINPLNKLSQKLDAYIINDVVRWVSGNITGMKFTVWGKKYTYTDGKLDEVVNTSPKYKEAVQNHRSWKQNIANSWVDGKSKSIVKKADNKQKVEAIKWSKNITELAKNISKIPWINASKNGKVEANGSVSPSWDKEFIPAKDINNAIVKGNFEVLNFQKWPAMLELRKKWVELYISEKIHSVNDMIDFVTINTTLFGGAKRQAKLLEILKNPNPEITDAQRLTAFNAKVQDAHSWISGAKSDTGFDMKKMIDTKVKDMTAKMDIIVTPEPIMVGNNNVGEQPIRESRAQTEARKKLEKTQSEIDKFTTDKQNYAQKAVDEIGKLAEGEQLFRDNKITKQWDKILLGGKIMTQAEFADFLYTKKLEGLQRQYDKAKGEYDKVQPEQTPLENKKEEAKKGPKWPKGPVVTPEVKIEPTEKISELQKRFEDQVIDKDRETDRFSTTDKILKKEVKDITSEEFGEMKRTIRSYKINIAIYNDMMKYYGYDKSKIEFFEEIWWNVRATIKVWSKTLTLQSPKQLEIKIEKTTKRIQDMEKKIEVYEKNNVSVPKEVDPLTMLNNEILNLQNNLTALNNSEPNTFARIFPQNKIELKKAEKMWKKEQEQWKNKVEETRKQLDIKQQELDKLVRKEVAPKKEKVDRKIVEKNAKLSNKPRLLEAEKLLWLESWTLVDKKWKITEKGQKILDAHKIGNDRKWAGVYTYDLSEIIGKTDILQQAWFTSKQIRILMEYGICGKNIRNRIIAILQPIKNLLAHGNVDLALANIAKISPSMEYVTSEMPAKPIDAFYLIADSFTKNYGIDTSDFMVFMGQLKMLKDSFLSSIDLYTQRLSTKNNVEEVVNNAKLNSKDRMETWMHVIEATWGIQLNASQKEIMQRSIMRVHAYGHTEPGKNGAPASIYNYTIRQLGKKMYVLIGDMQKCGIEYSKAKSIAKELLRKGICGDMIASQNVKPEAKPSRAEAEIVKESAAKNGLNIEFKEDVDFNRIVIDKITWSDLVARRWDVPLKKWELVSNKPQWDLVFTDKLKNLLSANAMFFNEMFTPIKIVQWTHEYTLGYDHATQNIGVKYGVAFNKNWKIEEILGVYEEWREPSAKLREILEEYDITYDVKLVSEYRTSAKDRLYLEDKKNEFVIHYDKTEKKWTLREQEIGEWITAATEDTKITFTEVNKEKIQADQGMVAYQVDRNHQRVNVYTNKDASLEITKTIADKFKQQFWDTYYFYEILVNDRGYGLCMKP